MKWFLSWKGLSWQVDKWGRSPKKVIAFRYGDFKRRYAMRRINKYRGLGGIKIHAEMAIGRKTHPKKYKYMYHWKCYPQGWRLGWSQ